MHDTAVRLIDAAQAELIAGDGRMEISAVAKRAGVSVGLAYHHFGSKTGLLAAVVDRFYEPIRAFVLGDEIALDEDWWARERARAEWVIAYFYDHPLAPLIAGRLGREPEVLDMERAHMDAVLEAGARNIAQGQRRGAVSALIDPTVAVSVLMGGLRLAIEQAVLADPRPPREALAEQFWVMCLGSLNPDHPVDAYSATPSEEADDVQAV